MADRQVLPGTLRLPPSRRDGVDLRKLALQFARFGKSTTGMPALEVTEGREGQLMINDGVTRATRAHCYADYGTLVNVVVIDSRPRWDLSKLPTVAEKAPC